MQKKLFRVCSILLLGSVAVAPIVGRAEPGMMGPDGGAHAMMHGGAGAHPHGHWGRHDDNVTGRDWKASLSEEQKAEIDWITLRLAPRQQLLKAQIDVKEAELDQLIVGDDAVQDLWQAKLDELLQLKREYLANRYQRMIEVRQVLTPQQRVAYDLAILSRR